MSHDIRNFQTTHWSLVVRAGDAASDAQRDALGALVRRYLTPLRSYLLQRFRLERDAADEVLAAFIATRLVEKQLVAQAREARGRFRGFLTTALERFAIDQARERAAMKRGGGLVHEELDAAESIEVGSEAGAAETALVGQWAREVVALALTRMRAATEEVRPDLWGVFADRVLGPAFDGRDPSAYATLVERLGFADEGQAANALHTAKRIFARTLRGVVAEYSESAAEVDTEVRELMAALATAGASR
jgi:RNA polymerase sigma-70 factor (ECF subfamily)